MKPRDIAFLAAAIVFLGALGLVVLEPGGAQAQDMPPPPAGVEAAPAPLDEEPESEPVAAMEPRFTPATPIEAVYRPSEDHSGRTDGMIRGHIALSTDVVPDLKVVYVKIREAINDADSDHVPYTKTISEEVVPEFGTPKFAIDGIPFSEFGYVVRAYATGFNGSEQFLQVTSERPVADVALSVTKASPFTVLLRDQMRVPVPGEHVFLLPVGEPMGRPQLQKDSDSYGAAVFPSVLAGEWDIRVGAVNAPRNPEHRVQVVAHAGVHSTTVVVPHGFDVTIQVQTRGGWGVEGAELMMYATDTTEYRKHEGTTDFSGTVVFPHLPPGKYHLNVTADGYQHWGRQVEVDDTGATAPITVNLVPR